MARCWYIYNGTGDKTLSGSYRRLDGQKPGCFSGLELSAIYTPSCGEVPDSPFSVRMTNYIIASLSSTAPQPNTSGAKYYLYKCSEE